MPDDGSPLFWDTCVLIRYLTASPPDLVDDIQQFIDEAKQRKRQILYSTILYAELRPRHLVGTNFGTLDELFRDLGSAFVSISPTPDILKRAGMLRDLEFRKSDGGGPRTVGTADSIHLMTCIHAREDLGLADIVFHTLDEGKGKSWEGKCVPLLGFEEWVGKNANNPLVRKVVNLPRKKPAHPRKRLL